MEKKASVTKNMEQSFFSAIKLQIKVALPWYISITVGLFAIFLPTIFGCNTYEEIGVILDRNFSFLSIFIFANVYYMEIQQKTEENFYLLPNNKKKLAIYKRIELRIVFAVLLFLLSYYLFTLHEVGIPVDDIKEVVIMQGIFAVTSNIIFFGGISCLAVNLLQNLWQGSGIGIVIWLILGSAWGKIIPDLFNVFTYGEADRNWVQGKVFGLFTGVVLFYISTNLIKKSPCKYKER